jgi:hypothetical protein
MYNHKSLANFWPLTSAGKVIARHLFGSHRDKLMIKSKVSRDKIDDVNQIKQSKTNIYAS